MKFKKALKRYLAVRGRGGQAILAAALDVNPSTVSRWVSGETRPDPATRRAVKVMSRDLVEGTW